MPGASRVNKDKAGPGAILSGSSDVLIEGEPAAFVGSTITPHGSGPHSSSRVIEGSSTVFINGKSAARQGDKTSCGHVLTGSSTVLIG
jgi:uncharacterized Zn-binding protein involved in type VI secretion